MPAHGERFEEGDSRYHPGGFHPVRLGEIYNFKYEVLRKVGYGRYSTVWLVKNKEYVKMQHPYMQDLRGLTI